MNRITKSKKHGKHARTRLTKSANADCKQKPLEGGSGGMMERALNVWVYAIAKTAYIHGIQEVLFRETENESAYIYFRMRNLKVPKAKSALEACKNYVDVLDKEGFLHKGDFKFKEKDGKVYVTIGGNCPYKAACEMMHRDKIPVVCARAASFSVATDLSLGKVYGTSVENFKLGEKCRIVVELPL